MRMADRHSSSYASFRLMRPDQTNAPDFYVGDRPAPTAMADGRSLTHYKTTRLEELLPWNWTTKDDVTPESAAA